MTGTNEFAPLHLPVDTGHRTQETGDRRQTHKERARVGGWMDGWSHLASHSFSSFLSSPTHTGKRSTDRQQQHPPTPQLTLTLLPTASQKKRTCKEHTPKNSRHGHPNRDMVLRRANRHSPLRYRCRPGRPCSGNQSHLAFSSKTRILENCFSIVHSLTCSAWLFFFSLSFFFLVSVISKRDSPMRSSSTSTTNLSFINTK